MLENERFNEALRTLPKYKNSFFFQDKENPFQSLLEQHYLTQKAFEFLGIERGAPAALSRINEVIKPPYYPNQIKKPLMVEVLGMPKAGKTTLIGHVGKGLGFELVEEQWPKIKKIVDKRGVFDPNLNETWKFGKQAGLYLQIAEKMDQGKIPTKPYIFDRGRVDSLVFLRAAFLRGEVDDENFAITEKFFELQLTFLPEQQDFNHALVICLVPPAVSLKREGPRKKPGRVMNPEFLSTLYEQYIRLYYELLTGRHAFTFTCLDLNTKNLRQSEKLFRKTLEEIILL